MVNYQAPVTAVIVLVQVDLAHSPLNSPILLPRVPPDIRLDLIVFHKVTGVLR
jgi:hypothetical protein